MKYPHYLTMALSKPHPVGLAALATNIDSAYCMLEAYTKQMKLIWNPEKNPVIGVGNSDRVFEVLSEWRYTYSDNSHTYFPLFLHEWIIYLTYDDRGKCISYVLDENGKTVRLTYYVCGCFV